MKFIEINDRTCSCPLLLSVDEIECIFDTEDGVIISTGGKYGVRPSQSHGAILCRIENVSERTFVTLPLKFPDWGCVSIPLDRIAQVRPHGDKETFINVPCKGFRGRFRGWFVGEPYDVVRKKIFALSEREVD